MTNRPLPALITHRRPRWRHVPFAVMYEASNDGRVRRAVASPYHPAGRVLRPQITGNGYVKYQLYARGMVLVVAAHRLVAMLFLPPAPPGSTLVLHRDDNKLDNRHANLRWGTSAQNTADSISNGRHPIGDRHPSHLKPWTRPRGENHTRSKLTEADVRAIMRDERSGTAIAAAYGVNSALIYRIRDGRVWRHVTDPAYASLLERGVVNGH